MNRRRKLVVAMLSALLLSAGLSCLCIQLVGRYQLFADRMCLEAPYTAPPPTLDESDLAGTWEAHYRHAVDRLVIRGDGTFKQLYQQEGEPDYVYETPWNEWWLEFLPDGRVHMNLQGARYYPRGIEEAELEGRLGYCPTSVPGCTGELLPGAHIFIDPVSRDAIHMLGELVLNVRVDSSGELLLHHMFFHGDETFARYGCSGQQFRRVETP